MTYFLIGFVAVIVATLLLRLRVRLELSNERRILFAGLGRSGVQIDYIANTTAIKLIGVTIKTMPRGDAESSEPVLSETISLSRPTATKAKKRSKRAFPVRAFLRLLPRIFRALRLYIVALFKAVIVEQAEAEVRAGFDSPHLTGQVYGYYFALIGAIPSLENRLNFYPDWLGASFAGSARLSLAMPLYALFYYTFVFIIRLPIITVIRIYRGANKGVVYVK